MNHTYTFKLRKELGATYREVRGHGCLRALLPAELRRRLVRSSGPRTKCTGARLPRKAD